MHITEVLTKQTQKMELKHLKEADKIAFANFGITNTIAGLVATTREMTEIRGALKQKFNLLWKNVRQVMNETDKVGQKLHSEKMQKLKPEERSEYIPLVEGYDDFAEDLTIFLEAWFEAGDRSEGSRTRLMQQIKNQVMLWRK